MVFNLLQQASGSDWREMYQVFNMGHRLEVFTSDYNAGKMIEAGKALGIEGRIVGRVEASQGQKELVVHSPDGTLVKY
jgi:phosphoribosylformylglycinamidine cyclo-ligase